MGHRVSLACLALLLVAQAPASAAEEADAPQDIVIEGLVKLDGEQVLREHPCASPLRSCFRALWSDQEPPNSLLLKVTAKTSCLFWSNCARIQGPRNLVATLILPCCSPRSAEVFCREDPRERRREGRVCAHEWLLCTVRPSSCDSLHSSARCTCSWLPAPTGRLAQTYAAPKYRRLLAEVTTAPVPSYTIAASCSSYLPMQANGPWNSLPPSRSCWGHLPTGRMHCAGNLNHP